jgi:sugar O-acyltransferase (sialic acid O-acetyltransferase NeuD family)
MSKRLLIVGISGYAKEVGQIARRVDPRKRIWDPISYVSETSIEKGGSRLHGKIDFCDEDLLEGSIAGDVVIGVGEPELRRKVASRYAGIPGLSFPNLIDPSVDIDDTLIVIGKGNVLHRGVILTCDVTIGDFNLFNKGAIISHDVRIGSYNSVQPGASILSRSAVGDGCTIGTGARMLPTTSIPDGTTLGAGTVLLRTISDPGVYIGVPARRLR